jgi:hypothetical protein
MTAISEHSDARSLATSLPAWSCAGGVLDLFTPRNHSISDIMTWIAPRSWGRNIGGVTAERQPKNAGVCTGGLRRSRRDAHRLRCRSSLSFFDTEPIVPFF